MSSGRGRLKAWRTIALLLGSLTVGAGVTLVLLIAYVIVKLYLAGHVMEPSWYDTAGSAVVFGGGLAAAIAAFVLGKRATGTRPGEGPAVGH
jgi:ammonia channel protein AmtB